MLKPLASRYNDWRRDMRWIKLKKDFIPGAGDTFDFHVVGASWNAKRGRELSGEAFLSHPRRRAPSADPFRQFRHRCTPPSSSVFVLIILALVSRCV